MKNRERDNINSFDQKEQKQERITQIKVNLNLVTEDEAKIQIAQGKTCAECKEKNFKGPYYLCLKC